MTTPQLQFSDKNLIIEKYKYRFQTFVIFYSVKEH